MNNIIQGLTEYALDNNLERVTELLQYGISVYAATSQIGEENGYISDCTLTFTVSRFSYKCVTIFINNTIYPSNIRSVHLEIVADLLEYGDTLCCGPDIIVSFDAENDFFRTVTTAHENGTTVQNDMNSLLLNSIRLNLPKMVESLLKRKIDPHIDNDHTLRSCVTHKRTEIISNLLERGFNMRYNNGELLISLRNKFDEELADAIFPHCTIEDHQYFPDAYVRSRTIQIKSANKIMQHEKIDTIKHIQI